MSLASVSRYMAAMEQLGCFTRERKPGRRYLYTLADAYRPRWPGRPKPGVPARQEGVSQAATQEAKPKKQIERERFADLPRMDDRERSQWQARLRSWQRSGGKFWSVFWGPTPSEPGCWAPPALLQTGLRPGG